MSWASLLRKMSVHKFTGGTLETWEFKQRLTEEQVDVDSS